MNTQFLVRTCVDRLASEGTTTVVAEMKGSDLRGLHSLQVRNKHGEVSTAVLELRFRRMVVRPPISKQKHYPELILTAIWRAFNNEFWPALYLVDTKGRIRHHKFGEGGLRRIGIRDPTVACRESCRGSLSRFGVHRCLRCRIGR